MNLYKEFSENKNKTILTSQVTQINGKIEIPDNIFPFKNLIQEE